MSAAAAGIRVLGIDLHAHDLRTRFPFRYGIAAMTHVPHLMLGARIEVDGQVRLGVSAENLVPKWFTKDPSTSPEQDVRQMLATVRASCDAAAELGSFQTVFDFWRTLYELRQDRGARDGEPPLLWGLGVSLVERAVIDAFCRARAVSFGDALRRNDFGIDLSWMYPELSGAAPSDLLPSRSLAELVVRHTVGLGDPLTDAQIAPAERVDDGLPQSLEAAIHAYGLTHFKIKLAGDVGQDLARLREIAALLERVCPDYALTLDANENFRSVAPLRDLWARIGEDKSRLGRFVSTLLFVEQPLHRDVALSEEARRELLAWTDRPPVIIDESGGTVQSVADALAGGYVGTSHKNCKGVIKGVAAACLLEHRRRQSAGRANLILSAEDLSNTGPVALLQDYAVIAALGIRHAERNGHHYFRGLSNWPKAMQDGLIDCHGDVYGRHPDGFAMPRVAGGRVRIGSAIHAPFGILEEPEFGGFGRV